jgi:putative dimethyl sulfoxide reductase chaperone
MDISQQVIDYERARSECYRLLAACFYKPKRETFLEDRLFENLTLFLRIVCPDAAALSEKMSKTIMKYSNEDLLVEYAKLFMGPFELQAAPYGSVYLDEGGKIMGDSTMEVIKTYRAEGLSLDENFLEPPDHITAELEFMYYLVFRVIEALEKSDNDKADHFIGTQERFQNRFLGWIKPFCDRIAAGTENEFYISLASCLSTFVLKSAVHNDLRAVLNRSIH